MSRLNTTPCCHCSSAQLKHFPLDWNFLPSFTSLGLIALSLTIAPSNGVKRDFLRVVVVYDKIVCTPLIFYASFSIVKHLSLRSRATFIKQILSVLSISALEKKNYSPKRKLYIYISGDYIYIRHFRFHCQILFQIYLDISQQAFKLSETKLKEELYVYFMNFVYLKQEEKSSGYFMNYNYFASWNSETLIMFFLHLWEKNIHIGQKGTVKNHTYSKANKTCVFYTLMSSFWLLTRL